MQSQSGHGCMYHGLVDGMNRQIPEIKATTMVDDRRLHAMGTETFRILEEAIKYRKTIDDEEVGNQFNS